MFQWDEANLSHIAIHSVTRAEAEEVIYNNPLDLEVQSRNGEKRIRHLGATNRGRVLFVITTMRNDKVRVITAFPADRTARRFWKTNKEPKYVQVKGDT